MATLMTSPRNNGNSTHIRKPMPNLSISGLNLSEITSVEQGKQHYLFRSKFYILFSIMLGLVYFFTVFIGMLYIS